MAIFRATVGLIFELIVFPYLLGEKYMDLMKKKERNGGIIYGYCVMCSLFYITIMPFIHLRMTLRIASIVWLIETIVLTLVLCVTSKNIVKIVEEKIIAIKNNFDKGKLIVLLLWIGIGLIALIFVPSVTSDETVVTALTTWKTDSMYVYDPYTKNVYWEFPSIAKAPIAIFYTVIAKITALSPVTVIKYVMPIILMSLCYQVYSLFSTKLFGNAKQRYQFQIVVILGYFGMLFFKEQGSMNVLQNIWNGNLILWNIFIPFALYLGLDYLEQNNYQKKILSCICAFIILTLTSLLLTVDGCFYISTITFICVIVYIVRWGIKYADNRKYDDDDIRD